LFAAERQIERLEHMENGTSTKWPKKLRPLTKEQARIRDEFMRVWLEVLPRRFGAIEWFNHRYPLTTFRPGVRTLEIGAGSGAHLRYEDVTRQEYVAVEIRPELANKIRSSFPDVQVIAADCQTRLDFPDEAFDRVLAIHVLEHLPDLPKALDQAKRLLKPGGAFCTVVPCEGGLMYRLARNVSARRVFEKRYGQSYDWLVASEHINRPDEIIEELEKRFSLQQSSYFPLLIPCVQSNLVIGLTYVK
jgi:SAM-dependent methyltransferase